MIWFLNFLVLALYLVRIFRSVPLELAFKKSPFIEIGILLEYTFCINIIPAN